MDIDFVEQLVESMEAAVFKLETVISSKNFNEANKLRAFVFDLHSQIDKALRG